MAREGACSRTPPRDERMAGLTDDTVDVFYSCSLCQSFAPNHICVVTPERLGLCGAYNWLDAKASNELNPAGPNQPIDKGTLVDDSLGQWSGVNEFIYEKSNNTVERMSCYSLMTDPMTSCGCFMCIIALMPMCNGVMIVNREYAGMTPIGHEVLHAGRHGRRRRAGPGFMGIGRGYIASRKFLSAEGGLQPRRVDAQGAQGGHGRARSARVLEEMGDPDFLDKIADETVGETEEAVLEYITANGHPALTHGPTAVETQAPTDLGRRRHGSERTGDLQAAAADQLRRLRRAHLPRVRDEAQRRDRRSSRACPHVSDEAVAALGAAAAPPMRAVTVGTGDTAFTVGEETVLFRHDKTFVNPCGDRRRSIDSGASDDEIDAIVAAAEASTFERVQQILRCAASSPCARPVTQRASRPSSSASLPPPTSRSSS